MRIISFLNPREPSVQTDLAWLAVRSVRALRNAGLPVQWQPLAEPLNARCFASAASPVPLSTDSLVRMGEHEPALQDLPALADHPSAAATDDTGAVLLLTDPLWWPTLAPTRQRRIGYLERHASTDPLRKAQCNRWVDDLCVPDIPHASHAPCAESSPSHDGARVHMLPPLRPHRTAHDIAQTQRTAFRQSLGLGEHTFVFYAMLDAHAAQDGARLITAYDAVFGPHAHADTALILQCPEQVLATRDGTTVAPAAQMLQLQLEQLGRTPPRVILLDQNLNTMGADLLHTNAHVLLTPLRGDGLGLRAMDAAAAGNEIIGPANVGLETLLGSAWAGIPTADDIPEQIQALAHAMQRIWSQADAQAAQRRMHMQWHVTNALSEAVFAQRVQHILNEAHA